MKIPITINGKICIFWRQRYTGEPGGRVFPSVARAGVVPGWPAGVVCVGGGGQVLWRGTHNKEKDLCAFERKKCPLHICSFKYMQYFIWLEWSEVVWTGLECNLLRYGWGQSSRFVMLFQVRILDEIFDHSHCQNVQSHSQKALIKRIFSRVKRPPDSMERRFPSSQISPSQLFPTYPILPFHIFPSVRQLIHLSMTPFI